MDKNNEEALGLWDKKGVFSLWLFLCFLYNCHRMQHSANAQMKCSVCRKILIFPSFSSEVKKASKQKNWFSLIFKKNPVKWKAIICLFLLTSFYNLSGNKIYQATAVSSNFPTMYRELILDFGLIWRSPSFP